jgi:thiol-disulfide isomerase/thioredoxin
MRQKAGWRTADMKKRSTIVIGAAVLVLAVLAVAQGTGIISGGEVTETAARPGFLAPPFELAGFDGNTYEVGGRRDKPLLVNFWASWCSPCHLEAPDLQKLYEEYEGAFDLYGVNVFTLDTRTGIRAFLDEYGITFPILLDETGEVTGRLYGVSGYPVSFLIDQRGVIVDAVFGIIDREAIARKIDRLLKEGRG